jgi:hypothetical protein
MDTSTPPTPALVTEAPPRAAGGEHAEENGHRKRGEDAVAAVRRSTAAVSERANAVRISTTACRSFAVALLSDQRFPQLDDVATHPAAGETSGEGETVAVGEVSGEGETGEERGFEAATALRVFPLHFELLAHRLNFVAVRALLHFGSTFRPHLLRLAHRVCSLSLPLLNSLACVYVCVCVCVCALLCVLLRSHLLVVCNSRSPLLRYGPTLTIVSLALLMVYCLRVQGAYSTICYGLTYVLCVCLSVCMSVCLSFCLSYQSV